MNKLLQQELDWVDNNLTKYQAIEHAFAVKQNIIKRYRILDLERALGETVEELESWWRDQGSYGTGGYDKMIPAWKKILDNKTGLD